MPILTDREFARFIGAAEARRQMKALPKLVVRAFGDAAETTGKAIVNRAQGRVPVRTGSLRDHLGYSRSSASGQVNVGIARGVLVVRGGYTPVQAVRRFGSPLGGKRSLVTKANRRRLASEGARLIQPTKYGHFAEFGKGGPHRGAKRQEFLTPAVEGSRDDFLAQMRISALDVERELIALGLRG